MGSVIRTFRRCACSLTSRNSIIASGNSWCGVVCECGTCREIEPETLARLVGCSVTPKELALRMRCSRCGKKAAEVVAVAKV
jgi:hypothetical protein